MLQHQNNARDDEDQEQSALNALIADYAAGALSRPAHLLMAAHFELAEKNRDFVRALEAAAAMTMQATPPEALIHRDLMLDRIFSTAEHLAADDGAASCCAPDQLPDQWLPSSLVRLTGKTDCQIAWRMKLPGVYACKLPAMDGCALSLLRIKPNHAVPTHTHEGRELTLVLKGSFHDGGRVFRRGDVAMADDCVHHRPVAGAGEDCICFIVNDAPLRFTGPLARFFSLFTRH